ncbi:CLUMA_CG014130, isoform A [Clunio marinus]|uniref:CLUMA_CG014130, isoform A n=1 Tax=Clunio marinus TaxID=568069 RepID=A0A1J1IKW7_9DIPT|nr:CLUMA_CG014130, isoform A [Clunio marinus]
MKGKHLKKNFMIQKIIKKKNEKDEIPTENSVDASLVGIELIFRCFSLLHSSIQQLGFNGVAYILMNGIAKEENIERRIVILRRKTIHHHVNENEIISFQFNFPILPLRIVDKASYFKCMS